MRNIIRTSSRNITSVFEFAVQRNKSFYFLVGSFGLFLMSAQFSQVIIERLLHSYNTRPSPQQLLPSIHAATPKVGRHVMTSEVVDAASLQKREFGIAATIREIIVEEVASAAGSARETSQFTSTIHEIDALSGEKLASHVKTTYKISGAMAKEIITVAISLSRKNGMDPFLTLGIIASESSFNHKAKSGYGATGLMQVYGPVHRNLLEELGVRSKSAKIVQKMLSEQIHLNVAAGIRIYKTYEKQYGSQTKALQAYNGAKWDASYSYAHKVLAVREQLRRVAASMQFDS